MPEFDDAPQQWPGVPAAGDDVTAPRNPPAVFPAPVGPGPVPAGPVPAGPAVPMSQTSPYILTIGDIGVTPEMIVTPNGHGKLAGSQWICTDMSRTESKTPTWAVVVAIIGFWLCLIPLFFLLVKEQVTTGYVEVSVRTAGTYHKTQIPISHQDQVAQIRQMVSQAQSLAAQASQGS